MKKLFSYLGWILLIAAIIAVFTSTGKEQCKVFITEKMAPTHIVSVQVLETPIKLFGAKFFSIYTVSYYKPSGLTLAQQAADSNKLKHNAAVAAIKANSGFVTETYIGIFNSFWKW